MKKILSISILFGLILSPLGHLQATEPAHEFFNKDKNYWSKGLPAPASASWAGSIDFDTVPQDKSKVAKMVADEAQSVLGPEYVDSALKLAHLESRFRCHVLGPKTRHGRAVGPLQVLPSSAKALGVHNMDGDCKAQIRAGIRHMDKCLKSNGGSMTHRQLSACHVAGWGGWNKRLNRKAERYKQQYIKLASVQKVPSWAGVLSTW
jgi:hypothetical protein